MKNSRIGKQNIKLFGLLLVNLFGGISSFCFCYTWDGRMINFLVLLIIYFAIYINLKLKEKVYFLIICIWQYTLMMETIYRLVRYEMTPFETYYIFDVLSLILTFEMFWKYVNRKIWKDKIYLVFSILLMFGTASFLMNLSNGFDYLNGMILAIKYTGIYLFFSNNYYSPHKQLKLFFIVSIIAFAVEVGMRVNVDFRNGLFGYEYTGGLFSLLLVSWSSICLINALYKNGKWFGFILSFVVSEICLILMDSKAEVIMYGMWVAGSFALVREKGTNGRKLLGLVASIGGMVTVWTIYTAKVTKFTHLVGTNIITALLYRLAGTNAIKYEVYSAIVSKELECWWQRCFGAGLGSAIPPRYVTWVFDVGKRASELFNIPKYSTIFDKYFSTRYYNMFGTSINYIRYDLGYIGIILLVILDILLMWRIIRVIRQKEILNRIIGIIALWQLISINFRIVNNNFIVQQLPMAISFAIFGIVAYLSCTGRKLQTKMKTGDHRCEKEDCYIIR